MQKHRHNAQHILKNLQSFREKQRKMVDSNPEQSKNQQYRELQEILSPFWAWRSKAI